MDDSYMPEIGTVTPVATTLARVIHDEEMKDRDRVVVSMLKEFYSNPHHFDLLQKALTIPMRLYDHLVTHYAEKNNVCILKTTQRGTELLNIHASYHSLLSGYKKHFADPYRRGALVILIGPDGATRVETTICQLNFIKWVIENDVYTYVKKHKDEIARDLRHEPTPSDVNAKRTCINTDRIVLHM